MIQTSINFSLDLAKHVFLPSFKAMLVMFVLSLTVITTAFCQFNNGLIGESVLFEQIGWVALFFFGGILKTMQYAKSNGENWY